MLCSGAGKTARCTKTKCQLVSLSLVSLCRSTPPSEWTGSFSESFALSHCPAGSLSNNAEFLHSGIPPSDPRELTIGKTLQLRKYKEGPCERSAPANGAAGTQWNRLPPHNKAAPGVSAIGLLFIPGTRSDLLLPPHLKPSVH